MISPPEQRPQILEVPDFWSRLRAAPASFLALDYDGTLAPFQVDRMKARPLPGVTGLLRTLSNRDNLTLVIVSGRPLVQLQQLLGDLGITLVGSHGYELLRPGGRLVAISPSPEQEEGLGQAEKIALRLGLEPHLERKAASLALHTRGLPQDAALGSERAIAEEWSRLAPRHGLECRLFNGGVEVRCLGRNKGDALRELLAEQPGDVFSVYIGDDETDEDAFRVMRPRGIGIRVGSPGAPTAATGFLADCEAVRSLLETWCRLTSPPPDADPAACRSRDCRI